jgi:pseudouridine-5'-phosphate glycosidase
MPGFAALNIRPEVAEAIQAGQPVVALESAVIAHGLPWPANLETARAAEAAVRAADAVPATIAVWQGVPTIGLDDEQLQELATSAVVLKASRRDLALAVSQGETAATTVAATMFLAHQVGIRVFATGGIGGAHPGSEITADISSDLWELARTPVAVICAGAKSIVDIPRTLQILETQAVPVLGYQTSEFPAFFVRSSGESVSAQVETAAQAAAFLAAHWALGGAGVVLAQPVAEEIALSPEEVSQALAEAQAGAAAADVGGPELTPYLLAELARITGGETVRANQALIVANAGLAAELARCLVTKRAASSTEA